MTHVKILAVVIFNFNWVSYSNSDPNPGSIFCCLRSQYGHGGKSAIS